jgi:S1-C subfamily serine protease
MRPFNLLAIAVFCGISLPNLMGQGGSPQALSGDQVVERVSPSAVSILVGKGDGQVAGVASGVIIRSDGVILTANHVVRGMREVQVRLKKRTNLR